MSRLQIVEDIIEYVKEQKEVGNEVPKCVNKYLEMALDKERFFESAFNEDYEESI